MLQPQACRAHLRWLLILPHQQLCLAPCDTDHYAHATTSLYKLRGLLQAAAGGVDAAAPAWALAMSAQDASWRVEEAKLLWAQGQQDTAVQLARSLLAARCGAAGGGACWRCGAADACRDRCVQFVPLQTCNTPIPP